MLSEAITKHNQGDIARAEVGYRNVLKTDPQNFDAMHMLAVVAYQTEQIDDSIGLFNKARGLQPTNAALLVNFGAALRKAKRLEDAIELYDQALKIDPRLSAALFNKAQCLYDLKKFEEAAAIYRESLAIRPDDSEIITALGNALRASGDWRGAIDRYEQAVVLNPKLALPFGNMAELIRERFWLSSSILLYDLALAIDPKLGHERMHRGDALFRLGRMQEGWENYDGRFWGWDERVLRRPVPPMYWGGEDLGGKSILIWTEQGVGDEILYGGMLGEVIARAGRVILECCPRMVPVFARAFPSATVVGWDYRHVAVTPAAGIDYQCAIASLGRYLRPELKSFPKHSGYLRADAAKAAALRARYGAGPLIGVSWRSKSERAEGLKSSALLDWEPILRIPGARFVNLQYGDCAEDLAAVKDRLGVEIINDPEVDALKDMDTFFAQVTAMDMVISTSSTTVHVAGSLGVPTWVLLPKGQRALWYWFLRREDNPWYPSLRLFRQTADAGPDKRWWPDVVARVAAELPGWLARRKAA